MKRIFAMLLVLTLSLGLLAGCGGNEAKEGGEKKADGLKVAVVVADGFGDKSFYDSAKAGADRLVADKGVELKTIECNGENFAQQMRNAAEEANVVIPVGWQFYEIEDIAPEYPEVNWIWVDNVMTKDVPNVLCITYAQNEGSFLAGYIAASLSKSGVIGAVGGQNSDTINDFMVGYKQGAEYKNPNVKVEVSYTEDFANPALGKEHALALNTKGADVIFQVAGNTGSGVFDAAAEKGFYAIGVDSDQKYVNDQVVVCSMVKEVGNSIYDAVCQILDGTFEGNRTWVADMSTGYIRIGYGEEGSTQQVSDDLKKEVEDLAAKIKSGEIKVETTRAK